MLRLEAATGDRGTSDQASGRGVACGPGGSVVGSCSCDDVLGGDVTERRHSERDARLGLFRGGTRTTTVHRSRTFGDWLSIFLTCRFELKGHDALVAWAGEIRVELVVQCLEGTPCDLHP